MATGELIFSEREGSAASTDGSRNSSAAVQVGAAMAGDATNSIPETRTEPIMENDNPFQRRVTNGRKRGRIMKTLLGFYRLLRPPLTPEQVAQMEEKKQRQILYKTLRADAECAERRMINRLTKMGVCHKRTNERGKTTIDSVEFDSVGFEPNSIWFHVDTDHLPWGVSFNKLKEKETVDNMAIACRHAVAVEWSVEKGVWYVMERASGAMGIPSRVAYMSLYERMPASVDRLGFALGMGSNNRPIYDSLSSMIHLLVAGGSGFGKTVFQHNLMCTLFQRNSPNQLRVAMVDLKGGTSFQYYMGLPHLLTMPGICDDGVCDNREDVFLLLGELVKEAERRMKLFRDAHCSDIAEYNDRRRKNRLADWVLVIDEWADVYLGSKSKEALDLLVNIAQRCRSVGIHLIVCTQVPQSAILPTLITANMPGRIGFHFSNFQGSKAIFEDGRAHNLKIKGRAAVVTPTHEVQVQAPYISNDMVQAIVKSVSEGSTLEINRTHDVTQDEVRRWAVRENKGELQVTKVYKAFREREIPRIELEDWLKGWDGQTFIIDGATYKCEKGDGSLPRRLVAVTADDDDDGPCQGEPVLQEE